MKLLFAGTPEIAVPALKQLAASEHQIVGVLTNPDRAAGRSKKPRPSPVKSAAGELDLAVLQPDRLGREARAEIEPLGAELLVCVAYGRIFGPRFLELFPLGGINLHPSLLPRYRGPAPIPAAIMNGDEATGVTIQRLAPEMDSGDILAQRSRPIDTGHTTGSLTSLLAQEGAELLARVVDSIADGSATPRPQMHDEATYTLMLSKSHSQIDWSLPAVMIERAVRALSPWPLAKTTLGEKRLSILGAQVVTATAEEMPVPGTIVSARKELVVATGNGLLTIQRLQLEGRKPMEASAFLNGFDIGAERLGAK